MDSIFNSIAETIKKRTASATIGTYIFFWGSYHWQGIYTSFFTSQDLIYQKLGLLKNEYVDRYFFGFHGIYDWGFYLGIIIPAVLTFLFIWYVPLWILIHFYRKEQRYKVGKRIVRIQEERKIKKEEEDLAEQTKNTIQAEIEVADKRKNAAKKDPKIVWNQDYNEFKKKNLMVDFEEILECIYKFNGNIYVSGFDTPKFQLDPNSLRIADSNGLINIVESGERIELTEKGKYFASKYEGRF